MADGERLPFVPLASKGWIVDATAKQPGDRLPGDVTTWEVVLTAVPPGVQTA